MKLGKFSGGVQATNSTANHSFKKKPNKADYGAFETLEQRKAATASVIFPHEFLYLICNTQNRVEQIVKAHKPGLATKELYHVNQFELDSSNFQQEGNVTTHIHLLHPDFREDRHPAKLVQEALDTQATQYKWKYAGAGLDGAKVKKIGDQDLQTIMGKGI